MESLSPFLWGSCIPYNMPVYPGALRIARDPPAIGGKRCGTPITPQFDGGDVQSRFQFWDTASRAQMGCKLFVAQCDHGVDAHRTARRNVRRG